MFLIRSRRAKGTMVEVVQGGKVLYKTITGMGAVESEKLTDDIKHQEKIGYVMYSHPEPKFPPKKPEPIRDDMTRPDMGEGAVIAAVDAHEAVAQGELVVEDEVVEEDTDEELEEEEEFFTQEDLESMTKKELYALSDKHGLDADKKLNKDDFIESMMEFEIVKG